MACEQAIAEAQKALDQSKILQADFRAKADREIQEIRALISKKQAEAPIGPVIPAPQDTADQSLMLQATQEWLVKQPCPHQIKYFLMNNWQPGPPQSTQPSPTAVPTPSGAGACFASLPFLSNFATVFVHLCHKHARSLADWPFCLISLLSFFDCTARTSLCAFPLFPLTLSLPTIPRRSCCALNANRDAVTGCKLNNRDCGVGFFVSRQHTIVSNSAFYVVVSPFSFLPPSSTSKKEEE